MYWLRPTVKANKKGIEPTMRAPRRHTKPRRRIQPPPGKSERHWERVAGEEGPICTCDSLGPLEAKLAAIDAEHARQWPNALVLL